MADSNYDDQERDFRRRWYEAHVRRFREESKDGPRQEVTQQGFSSRGSAARFLEFITGETVSEASEEYQGLLEQLGADSKAFEKVAAWWDKERPLLVDPVLADRCQFRLDHWEDVPQNQGFFETIARAQRNVAQLISSVMKGEASRHMGRNIEVEFSGLSWQRGWPRGDLWSGWRPTEEYCPGLRLWITQRGMAICLVPGIGPYRGKGGEIKWYSQLVGLVPEGTDKDLRLFKVSGGRYGEDRKLFGRAGSFIYGKWYEKDQLADLDLREEFNAVVPQLRPVLDRWMAIVDPPIEPPWPPPGSRGQTRSGGWAFCGTQGLG